MLAGISSLDAGVDVAVMLFMLETDQARISPKATSQPAAALVLDRGVRFIAPASGGGAVVVISTWSCGGACVDVWVDARVGAWVDAGVDNGAGRSRRVSWPSGWRSGLAGLSSGSTWASVSGTGRVATAIEGWVLAASAFSRATLAAGCWESWCAGSPSGRHDIDHFPKPDGLAAGTVSSTGSTKCSNLSCSWAGIRAASSCSEDC